MENRKKEGRERFSLDTRKGKKRREENYLPRAERISTTVTAGGGHAGEKKGEPFLSQLLDGVEEKGGGNVGGSENGSSR